MSLFGDVELSLSKRCVYCDVEKPLQCFPKHSQKKDKHDTRCRECIRHRASEVNKIRKTAPPKPEFCECCGRRPYTGRYANPSKRQVGLVLDHDTVKKTFRGWLCDDCNKSIGSLGDNVEGLMRAVNYLQKRL